MFNHELPPFFLCLRRHFAFVADGSPLRAHFLLLHLNAHTNTNNVLDNLNEAPRPPLCVGCLFYLSIYLSLSVLDLCLYLSKHIRLLKDRSCSKKEAEHDLQKSVATLHTASMSLSVCLSLFLSSLSPLSLSLLSPSFLSLSLSDYRPRSISPLDVYLFLPQPGKPAKGRTTTNVPPV